MRSESRGVWAVDLGKLLCGAIASLPDYADRAGHDDTLKTAARCADGGKMEGQCLTQVELLGQIANYLKIHFREEKVFFYLGAPRGEQKIRW